MKRTALLFLTAVYLLSLVGIGISRFYCCGKLASVTLTFASADHADKDNCCKHESKSFKIKDSHVANNIVVLSQLSPALLPAPIHLVPANIQTEGKIYITYQANAPPGSPEVPLYTLNCTYKI